MLCRALGRLTRAAGAIADYERAMPEYYMWDEASSKVQEAILDVVLTWPGALALQTIDVCISCPHAERADTAWKKPGVAAASAERRKATRYGPEVMPLSIESHGRLGPQSLIALEAIARQASAYGTAKVPPAKLVQRWRADIELALYFTLADTMLQARGALPEKAGPDSFPVGRILPGTSRTGPSAAETQERSAAAIGDC